MNSTTIVAVARQVQVSAGGVRDLGYQVVWCSKFRCPILPGLVQPRCGELIRAGGARHSWQIVAQEVMPDRVYLAKAHLSGGGQRYIDTHHDRPWREETR